ncbi:MAG: MOSC domain-containing protein [Lacunisphaera sp.]|nr:MOSC domain-containing protein [Lacunisphaera sp.]
MPSVTGLFIYPVKSCRGLAVPSAELDDHGFIGDRRFMVVTEAEGMFLTQRAHPRMALIETTLNRDSLFLSSPARGSVTIPLNASHGQRRVTVWKSTVNADDCGEEAAEWLTAFLGLSLRLVRMGGTFQRPNLKPAALAGDVVTFADSCPFLIICEASLADLNSRLAQPLPMNRFRPNIVVQGCAAFAEDNWTRFKIGGLVFRTAGPSVRCPITTTDQLTAVRGKEPLKTLATYRRDPADPGVVVFGVNLIHETKRGTLRVGAMVEPV